MDRIPVDSSNLASVGYDQESGTLEIEFHSGRVYRYTGVPRYLYEGLMQAPSKGRFFNSEIKPLFYGDRC